MTTDDGSISLVVILCQIDHLTRLTHQATILLCHSRMIKFGQVWYGMVVSSLARHSGRAETTTATMNTRPRNACRRPTCHATAQFDQSATVNERGVPQPSSVCASQQKAKARTRELEDNRQSELVVGLLSRVIFMKRFILTNTGYSIVEVLVAVTVLLIAIVGPMTIASKGLQNAQLAREETTAAFLAQEGIELIHLWRNNRALSFYLNGSDTWSWVPTTCQTGSNGCDVGINESGYMTVVACASKEACRLNEHTTGRTFYRSAAGGTASPFVRQVYIDPGTGNITLKRLLTEDSSPRYNIRVIAILVDLWEPSHRLTCR